MTPTPLLAFDSVNSERVVALFLIGCLALWLWAFVDCVKNVRGTRQTLLLLFILCLGFVGAPLYLLLRKLIWNRPTSEDLDDFFCCRCGQPYGDSDHETHKTDVFGLHHFRCASCGQENTFPPAESVQTTSWIALVLFPLIGSSASDGNANGWITFWALTPTLWAIMSLNGSFRWGGKVKRAKKFFRHRRLESEPG